MLWPRFKVFWSSKDNPTGHSERKKKKRQIEEEVGRQNQRVDRTETLPTQNGQLKKRTRWKGIVANTSLVPPTTFQGYGICWKLNLVVGM